MNGLANYAAAWLTDRVSEDYFGGTRESYPKGHVAVLDTDNRIVGVSTVETKGKPWFRIVDGRVEKAYEALDYDWDDCVWRLVSADELATA